MEAPFRIFSDFTCFSFQIGQNKEGEEQPPPSPFLP
jgi:hypothetical protein